MPNENPLLEPDDKSLNEIFSMDPFKLQDPDIEKAISQFRILREKLAISTPEKKTKEKAQTKPTLSLSDL